MTISGTAPPGTYRVDPSTFTSVENLTRWQDLLDQRGLRATGSPAHAEYVNSLAARLVVAGVQNVCLEPVAMERWTPQNWSLTVAGEPVSVLSCVAYSGDTGPDGVLAPLSPSPRAGAIGVVDVPVPVLPQSMFDALDWDPALRTAAPQAADRPYQRVAFSQDAMRDALARHQHAGAVGLVLIVDLPAEQLRGAYLLYDGAHRTIPALFVSREQGTALRAGADQGATAHLTLQATVQAVETHNVVGLIPGRSTELVVVQSHTDGPNGIEDNGPEAIVAMARYLAEQPADDLERSVLIVLTTGHFALEEAWGVRQFLQDHADDFVPRIAVALSIEHLGALPSRIDRERDEDLPTFEFGCFFATGSRALIDVVRSALDRAAVTESRVLRPFMPASHGSSPDGLSWPGDGCGFWEFGGLPTANFITGPDYLFNVEPLMGFIDMDAFRRQTIAFTEATLELCATPWQALRAADAGDHALPQTSTSLSDVALKEQS